MARVTAERHREIAATNPEKPARKRAAKKVAPTVQNETPAPGIDTSARDSYALYPSQLVIVASAEFAGEVAAWTHVQRAQDASRAKAVILRELLEAGLKAQRAKYERRYGKLDERVLTSAIEHEKTDGARARRIAKAATKPTATN